LPGFNELTGNSGGNAWCIGRATLDIASMRLISPSRDPIIAPANLTGSNIAFVADPFRVVARDITYVFAEVWSRSNERGQIAAFRLNTRNEVTDSATVLTEPFHLSYPCVFKINDDYYMLPEAWESGKLTLYKARTFPWDWERFQVLLSLDYADPQIFFHKDKWYIFLNSDPLANASMCVYWSDSPLQRWHSHNQNPIFRNDARQARSAGPLLRYGDRVFRFSQDCRRSYGESVYVSEVTELSPLRITIVPIGEIKLNRPKWARSGFHHVDAFIENGAYYALFDGYTRVIEP